MNIDHISILQVSLNELTIDNPLTFDPALARSFAFDLQHTAEFDPEEGLVMAVTSLQATTVSEEEQEEEATAEAVFSILFQVNGLEDQILPGIDGEMKGSRELKVELAAISLSTVRGLMSGYLNNTVLSDFLIPVIDPEPLADY